MNSDCTRKKLSAALGACAAEINLLRKRRIGPYFPDFSANRTTMHLKIVKIWPRFSTFSLRSFLPRRLLVRKGCPGEDRHGQESEILHAEGPLPVAPRVSGAFIRMRMCSPSRRPQQAVASRVRSGHQQVGGARQRGDPLPPDGQEGTRGTGRLRTSNLKKHQTSIPGGFSSPGRPRPSPECPRIDELRRHGP